MDTKDSMVIFVATDFSRAADAAVLEAHRRAEQRQARLYVCHIVPNQLGVNMLFPQAYLSQTSARAEVLVLARDALIARTEMLTGRTADQFEAVVADGEPYACIVDEAERARAQLVVIGARAVAGPALGSVAVRVVRYAHSSVLAVRTLGPPKAVLVATDLSDPSLPALQAAKQEAGDDTLITALHCLEPVSQRPTSEYDLPYAPMPPTPIDPEERSSAEAHLRSALAQLELGAGTRVVEGDPATSIISAAEVLPADLLILATRGRTGLRRVLLGSVAELVVDRAPCSVLVVRAGRAELPPRPRA